MFKIDLPPESGRWETTESVDIIALRSENAALKGLVGEMEPFVRKEAYRGRAIYNEPYNLQFCAKCGEEWGYGHKAGCSVGKAQTILESPLVKAIMEEVEGG